MSEASELIAQQILNASINKKNWGQVLYNVKVFGAQGDGIYDDTQAVQDAIDTAIFNNATLVYFPPGTYKVTSLSNTETINFVGDNAVFSGISNTITQFGGGPQRQQIVINGGFAINQRVVNGTVVLAANQYGHDRWKAGSSGCTYTFSTINNVTTLTITSGTLVQVIEGLNLISDTYTLSWGGTSQGKIGTGSFSTSGVTGVVVGGENLSIEFNTGTLSNVLFHIGEEQTIQFQPKSFSDELSLCQRYYEKSYDYGTAPGSSTTSNGMSGNDLMSGVDTIQALGVRIPFKVRKRIAPTVYVYDASGNLNKVRKVQTSGVATDNIAVTIQNIGESSFQTFITGTAAVGYIQHYTADAEL